MRAGTPILERGGWKTAFEHSFQWFAEKSFVKLSRKGGRGGGGVAALAAAFLNPRMAVVERDFKRPNLDCLN